MQVNRRRERGTSTSSFGVGRRESHDASSFYARFPPKQLSDDETVADPFELQEPLVCGDSRDMKLPDSSVALVVTSPPYFAGKEYETALGQGLIPASYADYLEMLRDVFSECARVLEPGGRIAVNIANLGRRPYRSLAGDVVRILEDDLGLLLRGEVVWVKAEGASGSCAWGSYRSPANPVLRDVTERVVIASKGRFNRAVDVEDRRARGLPCEATISTDEVLEATLDLWRIPTESARRVGHPAPFPVELPQRLIELYTFRNDLVLDPFLGSGSTAVAAVRTGRRYAGYDTDAAYVELAHERVENALAAHQRAGPPPFSSGALFGPVHADEGNLRSAAAADGRAARSFAADMLRDAGFDVVDKNYKISGLGLSVSLVATDREGASWYFDVTGAFTSIPSGLQRTDTLWKCLGRASVLATRLVAPLVVVSSHLPARRSSGDHALHAVGPAAIHDVIGMLDPADRQRLAVYAAGGHRSRPLAGFWTAAELGSPRAISDPAPRVRSPA
jgi:site-specific DNA-methyltransferase (adenine-specific)